MYKLLKNGAVQRLSDKAIIQADDTNRDWQEYQVWIDAGNSAEPANVPTSQEVEAEFTAAIQKRLDDFARTRHYDNILSACTYATSAIPKFRDEGQACVNLRDATWAGAYAILAAVQASKRPMPKNLADIEADLPALEWPQ